MTDIETIKMKEVYERCILLDKTLHDRNFWSFEDIEDEDIKYALMAISHLIRL
tara:strand:+ start:328 stop:486 length:159 start_codon:yes stop_codon:yes gene_type:complete